MAASIDNINLNYNSENSTKKNKEENEVAILSILDKSYYQYNLPNLTFNIPKKLLNDKNDKNSKLNGNNNNITLTNAIYNSLINNDYKSFLFCIQQNNETLIEETIKQMNRDCIEKFIEKSLDIFQSNFYNNKNILIWINKLAKIRKIDILSSNQEVIRNLIKLQFYIKEKSKNYINLCRLKQKIKKINETFSTDQKISDKKEKNEIIEPLLTYIESEDENEKKQNEIKKKKMGDEGFEEGEGEMEEEENEEEKYESEENYLDEEIDNMDIEENDKISKKNKNKKEEDEYEEGEIDGEEDEEKEDEEDED